MGSPMRQENWKNMQSLDFLMPRLLNELWIERNSSPNIEIFSIAPVVFLSFVFEWKKRLVDANVSNIVKMFKNIAVMSPQLNIVVLV